MFAECHRSGLIDPDPLLVVRGYPELPDREIAAVYCASLALGRASAIVDACRRSLAPFGPRLRRTLASLDFSGALDRLSGFRYRFYDAVDAAALLRGAAGLAETHGTLEAAFVSGAPSAGLLERCDAFSDRLRAASEAELRPRFPGRRLAPNLLSTPRDGSACKRLMLFLRWMVRSDAVDPGGWTLVEPAELVLPLDVHLHRIALRLGLTRRKAADLKAALEVTGALRSFDPKDPVRFDFSLARLGIRSDYSLNSFVRS